METTAETNNQPAWADAAAASAEAETARAEDAMPPRRFEEMLPCRLTDAEKLAKAEELEAALAAVDLLEAEKKAKTAEINARIKLAKSKVSQVREEQRTSQEMRSVECIQTFLFRLGVARKIRTDTGECIEDRALRACELQPTLPLADTRQTTLDEALAEMGAVHASESRGDLNNGDDLPDALCADDDGEEPDGTAITEPDKVLGEEEAPKKRSRRAKA